MASSLISKQRPLMAPRTLSSKNSNPYLAMNQAAGHAGHTSPPVPDLIMPGLYLTDLFTARQTLLPTYPSPHRPQIKYVLSLLDNSLSQPHPKPESRASLFTQNLIIIDDVPEADLLAHLTPACDWIEKCLANNDGNVLVHCHMGQSRSAAVVVAYVMRREKIGVERAIERVKRRRSVVRVNVGFVKQLGLWESMGYDVWEEEVVGGADGGIVAPDLTGGQGETVVVEKKVVRRRKEAYETWRSEQERRTKKFLENLG